MNAIDKLREQGKMTWIDEEHGWIADEEHGWMRSTGGVWQGVRRSRMAYLEWRAEHGSLGFERSVGRPKRGDGCCRGHRGVAHSRAAARVLAVAHTEKHATRPTSD
ncbi:MAG TPA: hypothetical protein VFD67_02935 [Gemmatimonadaceae bacterium]|nr:hypothetical protein [Gemmatimonadaceae bacterium]